MDLAVSAVSVDSVAVVILASLIAVSLGGSAILAADLVDLVDSVVAVDLVDSVDSVDLVDGNNRHFTEAQLHLRPY